MTPQHKPRGYFDFVLALDIESSGMAFNSDDPSVDSNTGATYQPVSVGLIVADANTLEPVKELYVEIKHEKPYTWDDRAERVHGLSREYLDKHGMSMEDAVVEICNLIVEYWGPDNSIRLLGHNVATFDLWFLRRLMRTQDIELKFGSRHIDTSSVGFVVFSTYNSDDLFETVGIPPRDPSKHNALDDARYALKSMKIVRNIFEQAIGA